MVHCIHVVQKYSSFFYFIKNVAKVNNTFALDLNSCLICKPACDILKNDLSIRFICIYTQIIISSFQCDVQVAIPVSIFKQPVK